MDGSACPPWSIQSGRVVLHVHLTPKGGRDALEGVATLADGASVLKMKVRSPPEDGKANAAAIACLAKALGLAKSAIELTAGAKSRHKTFKISGDGDAIVAILEKLSAVEPT